VKRVLVVVGAAACSRHTPSIPAAELVADPLGEWRAAPAASAGHLVRIPVKR
jgi:hypothetical protein